MRWRDYDVYAGDELLGQVRALSRADALWRALNRQTWVGKKAVGREMRAVEVE